MSRRKLSALFMIAALSLGDSALAGEKGDAIRLEEVIVTAPSMTEPLTVETDPKNPRQPVPPADGAGYLKNIPGFSVTRKGGSGGDPVLRGLAGSRVNILLDGEYLLGGCGGRMDPPTAYVFPESYDKITVLKGPQSVAYGGAVAGTVIFERDTRKFEKPGAHGTFSLMGGSFGRNDQMADVTGGMEKGFLRVTGTRSDSNNYEDGDGHEVHSFYTRESVTGVLGLTPWQDTLFSLTADFSKAEAAYADRTMDGKEFDRKGLSFKAAKKNISDVIAGIELMAYYNYIDHVMDNFSLRPLSGMAMVSNPDRKTQGAKATVELTPKASTSLSAGVDYEKDERTSRSGVNYSTQPRVPDMTFEKYGIFAEVRHELGSGHRLSGGARVDFVDAKNEKAGSIADDSDTIKSAFIRYEREYSKPLTSYVGLGMAERSPDWWERNKVFYLDPERNVQADLGFIYTTEKLRASVSAFYSKINDYILVQTVSPTARNIDATTYGGEAEVAYSPIPDWTATATAAYVRGENDTDNRPLPQISPLEGTIGVKYDNKTFLGGVLLRAVARQDRVDVGNGSIVGTDIGETPGFAVLSANAGYRPVKGLLVSGGVDNILDKAYAEHISKATSSSVTAFGLEQTTRVNEPGRTFWVKANYTF